MPDWLKQPDLMEPALLRVWDTPLHIFQCAGHPSLTVPLHHRKVDQKVRRERFFTDPDLHAGTVHKPAFVFLKINKWNFQALQHRIIPADKQCIVRSVPDPGSFADRKIPESCLLKVSDHALHNLRVCCRPLTGRNRSQKVGLEDDLCFIGRTLSQNHFPEACLPADLIRHHLNPFAVDDDDLLVSHEYTLFL